LAALTLEMRGGDGVLRCAWMAFAGRAAWTVIAGIAAAAGACDAVLGIRVYPETTGDGGTAGADADVQACGISAGSASCAACIQATCCPQAQACAGSSACAAYEDCVVPCGGDYACKARCLIAEYASAVEIPEMDQCVAKGCATQCGLTCDTTASYAEPDAAAGCQQCLTANACPAATQCQTNLECQDVAQCENECESLDCFWGCGEGRDAGAQLFYAYAFGLAPCAGACSAGEYWDCPLGSGLAVSETGQTTITLNLVVAPDGKALAGASVKACDLGDTACTAPVVPPGTTDAQGNVTFVLPAFGSLEGFLGYFDIASPSTYPTLYFLQSHLSVPQVTVPAVPYRSFKATTRRTARRPTPCAVPY
jgi:hypothetical protein